MSTAVSEGLRFKGSSSTYLRLGFDELAWVQYQDKEDACHARLGALARTGLIIQQSFSGQLEDDWLVQEDPSNTGYLAIGRPILGDQIAVDSSGRALVITGEHRPYSLAPPRALLLSVPNDGVWRTLVLRAGYTSYEPGTLAFSSSTSIVGTGTDFTRYSGSNEGGAHGSYVRVDPADNATLGGFNSGLGAGIYEISTVTAGTTASITATAPATASGIPFSIAGSYYPTDPASSSRDVHRRLVPTFALVSRTRLPSTGDIVLADVRRSAGTMEIIDRRDNSLAQFKVRHTPYSERVFMYNDMNTGSPAAALTTVDAAAVGVTYTTLGIAPNSTLDKLLVTYDLSSGGSACRVVTPVTDTVAAAVLSGGGKIVRIPQANGAVRHLAFYVDTSVCYMKTSDNNGSTWSAASAIVDTSAGTPSGYAVAVQDVVLLRSGRVVVILDYSDMISTNEARAVYSDDYGSAWSVNSNEGYVLSGSTLASYGATLSQDPITGLCWLSEHNGSNGKVDISVFNSEQLIGGSIIATGSIEVPASYNALQWPCARFLSNGQMVLTATAYASGPNDRQLRLYRVARRTGSSTVLAVGASLLLSDTVPGTGGNRATALCEMAGGVYVVYARYSVASDHHIVLARIA